MIRVACFVQINTLQPLVKMVSLLRIFRVSFRYFRVTISKRFLDFTGMHRAAENAKAARFSWTASVLPFILDQFSMEQMTVKFFFRILHLA